MTLIYSTDTTTSAITTYNNMLTGGTFDILNMPWTPYSGYSITKRDNFNPNTGITIDTTPGGFLLAGILNTANTNSNYVTVFGGSGNTIDFFNNKIFAGENNLFESAYNPLDYIGINFNGSSIIMGGNQNNMIGFKYPPEISTIMNGSGNSIINLVQLFQYSDDYKRNTIINGLSNTINGLIGNSWIGNGSGNTIQGETKGNFILNGHNNIISSTALTYNYNSIIGGFNSSITNQNNSIVIGSNLIGSANTTSVNNMFFTDKMFVNDYVYSAASFSFNHENKLIGIIQNTNPFGDTTVVLSNGTYDGQILFLIGIPSALPTPQPTTYNILLDSSNVISLSTNNPFGTAGIILNNIYSSFTPIIIDPMLYVGLGIFIWDSSINYWVRADYRGGI